MDILKLILKEGVKKYEKEKDYFNICNNCSIGCHNRGGGTLDTP